MVRLSGNNSPNATIYFNDDELAEITEELKNLQQKLVDLPGKSDKPILPTLAEFIDQGGEVAYDESLEKDGSVDYTGDYSDEFKSIF